MKDLRELAEQITEGVWDVPAIETRAEFLEAVRQSLEGAIGRAVKEEREACAMAVENFHDLPGGFKHSLKPNINLNDGKDQLRWYANAVRARG